MSDEGPCDTYYVYNDWDQLIAVLPPALIHGLPNSEQTQTYYTAQANVFLQYAYLYKYDIQNHRVGVKLPGVDWHYTVYDGDHRPVLGQDGRQRLSNEWTFYKYDGLGRIILEGVFKGSTLDNMIQTYADKLVKEEYTGNTSPTSFGYSENIIYPYPPTITKAYYYDTYDFRKGMYRRSWNAQSSVEFFPFKQLDLFVFVLYTYRGVILEKAATRMGVSRYFPADRKLRQLSGRARI